MKYIVINFLMVIVFVSPINAEAARVSSSWFYVSEIHITEFGWISVVPQTAGVTSCTYPRMKEGSSNQTTLGVNRSLSVLTAAMYASRQVRVDYEDSDPSCWIYKVYVK